MSLSYDNANGMVMPVSPMPYGGNGGFGFGGDGAWWLIVLLLIGWGGNGFGNGFGGGSGQAEVQRGFDQSAVMNGISGVTSAITNLGTAMNAGFANAETADNARQIANMQQAFAAQTAMTSGMNTLASQISNCCCQSQLQTANLNSTILAENCADRAALSDALRDVITSQNAGVQRILDTMCQDKIDAKNEKIADLQNQLAMAQLAASQNAQTASIIANNEAQTGILERYLAPSPVPAYIVQNPNGCGNYFNGYGCGCNA